MYFAKHLGLVITASDLFNCDLVSQTLVNIQE